MPANATLIRVTANGVTKLYVRLWNGVVEAYSPPVKSKTGGEW